MRIGRMRFKIGIEEPAPVADSIGQMVPTWNPLGEFWGDIQPLAGREAESARQLTATATHQVIMRFIDPALPSRLSPQHRLKFGSRIFNIDAVLNFRERSQQFQILATEVV